jgi:acyl-CoA thioesterase YciA
VGFPRLVEGDEPVVDEVEVEVFRVGGEARSHQRSNRVGGGEVAGWIPVSEVVVDGDAGLCCGGETGQEERGERGKEGGEVSVGHDAVDQTTKMDLCGMQLLGTKVCKKHDLGVHNNLFGGTMLGWIDEVGVAFVNEVCYSPNMVTLKVEEVLFTSPVKENNLIKLYGEVVRIGNKSITVAVEARKFNVYSHEENVVTTTRLVFVRIDEDGNSLPIAQHVKDKHPDKLA